MTGVGYPTTNTHASVQAVSLSAGASATWRTEKMVAMEDMEESRENLEGLVQRLTIQNDALVAAIEKLYSYIDYGKFANERTDDADFIDAVLKQVK